MNIWGSIPDWLNVLIAFIALIGFFIYEQKKMNRRIYGSNSTQDNKTKSEDTENELTSLIETKIEIRAAIYSRILIGIIFGSAIPPILYWLSINFFTHNEYDFDFQSKASSILVILFSIILSSLLTLIYLRSYRNWAIIFVHWVERLAISYGGFFSILSIFTYWHCRSELEICYLESYKIPIIIVSVVMFLLLGFSPTPIDAFMNMKGKSEVTKK